MVAKSVIDLIGKTPLVKLESFAPNLYAKCEFLNPGGSVKDRAALYMIKKAIDEVGKDVPFFEPTSGNTGIALAMIAAKMGLDLTIVMPESMSIERRKIIRFLGAKLVLTPAELGMQGAIEKAKELAKKEGGYIFNQFENPANPKAHEETTAKEILEDLKNIDYFVAGVGTGGTIMGVSRVLGAQAIAVEPKRSAVLSGQSPGPHQIQGIGAGFIPKIVNPKRFAKIVTIDDEEAFIMAQKLSTKEGLMVGISSGANVAAALKVAQENPDKIVVTILPDTALRYMSTPLFDVL